MARRGPNRPGETPGAPRASLAVSLVALAALAATPRAEAGTLTVRLPDGTFASDARLVEAGAPSRVIGRVRENGRLELPEGSPEACLVAPGHVPVLVSPSGAPEEIVLESGAALHGTVADPDGRPLGGVALDVQDASEVVACLPTTRTDASGRYELTGLPAGTPRLRLSGGPAYATERPAGRLRPRGRRRLDVSVHRAVLVDLTVRGAEGRPLPGAEVVVLPEWTRQRLDPPLSVEERERVEDDRRRTDEKGRVSLVLPWRDSWRVAVRHEAHAPASVRVAARRDVAPAALDLRRGGRIALRAVDADGRPWPAPTVRLHGGETADADLVDEPEPGASDGKLAVDHVPHGRWTVELRATGARPRLLRGVAVREEAATDLGEVVLAPGAALAGVVEDAAAAPVADAEILLAGWVEGRRLKLEQRADREGRFRFEGLDPDSRGRLTARADGFVEVRLEHVAAGTLDAVLTLERAGAVRATVLDAETHARVTNAAVEAVPEDGGRPVKGEPEEDGYVMTPLRAGEWRLRASAPGHLPHLSDVLDVLADEEPLEVELALDAGRRLEGRVLAARDGAAIAGAEVTAEQRGVSTATRSGLDGRFVLDGLDDRVDLSVSHGSYRSNRLGEVDLAETAQPLDVRLERGGSLEGTVLGADGLPAVGAQVRLGLKSALTDENGGYVLEGLPPGSRKVSKVDRPRSFDGFEEAWVEIVDGELTRHDFGLGTRISGTVTSAGEPAPGAQLTLWESSARRRASNELLGAGATAGEDGEYVLAGVPFGESTLVVRWQDRLFSRGVSVPAGVRDLRVDVEIPDLHVGGLVLDASTREPVSGASVSAQPRRDAEDARPQMMQVTGGGPDREPVTFATFPFSRDQTGADGRFRLLLDAPGRYDVMAIAPGYRMVETDEPREPMEVVASRDDLVLEMRGAARVTLKLREAASGAPVHGGYLGYRTRSSSSMTGGSDSAVMDSVPSGERVTFVGWKRGWSPDVLALTLEAGEERTIDLGLGAGGTLSLLVPEGSLETSGWGSLKGSVQLLAEDGIDLLDVLDQAIGGNATQVAPDEWRLDHLPEGPLTVVLGEGDDALRETVEIATGLTAEADLR